MKRAIQLGLSLALSGLFLWLAFRNVDGAAMWAQIRRVNHAYTALYVAMLVVTQICRALRWDVLIRPFARVSMRSLFRISNVGLMLMVLLPLRLGEFARPYLLKKETGARMSAGIGAVVVERAIDGLLITLLFFVTTTRLGAHYAVPRGLRVAAVTALLLFVGVTVVIVTALIAQERIMVWVARFGSRFSARLTDRLVGMLEAFVGGLRSLPNARAVTALVGWTLAYWVANGLGLYWMMRGFGWTLPPVAGFVLVCVIVIAIMIPAGPGFLGTYQGAILLGLAIFGIGDTAAAAYGTLVYPINMAVVVAFGLPYLFARGTRVTEIVRESRVMASQTAEP